MALLVVKGRIGWHNGRIRLPKGAMQMKTARVKDDRNGLTVVVLQGGNY